LAEPLLYGDMLTVMTAEQPCLYEAIDSFATVKDLFQQQLEAYNEAHSVMNLVLFEDAL